MWNHKFFVNIYEGLSDFEITITEGDITGMYDDEMIGETITNTYELIDLQKGTRDGGSNWFQFTHPDSGDQIGKILIRVKYRNPENHKEYLQSIFKQAKLNLKNPRYKNFKIWV